MTAAEALASEGDVPDNQGKKRKRKRKAIFSKQNITPQQTGLSSTPVSSEPEVTSQPEEETHDTPIIPINAEVAEQRKREAFTQNLLAALNAPAPLRLKRPPAPKPTHKIAYHIDDLHTTLGMLLVRKGDMEKLNKIKSSERNPFVSIGNFLFPNSKHERSAIDKPAIGGDKFAHDYHNKSKGIYKSDLSKGIFPDVFPYEREAIEYFSDHSIGVVEVLSFVQKLHYESHLNDDPKKAKRKYDFRGNDIDITGQSCQKILELSHENRIKISDDPALRPEISPSFESMNQKNLLFREYGRTFVARMYKDEKRRSCELDEQRTRDIADEHGMTSWQWVKEVVRQTLHPR